MNDNMSTSSPPPTVVYVEPPRRKRWWIGVVIALLVVALVLVLAVARKKKEERADRTDSVTTTLVTVPGGESEGPGPTTEETTEPTTEDTTEPTSDADAASSLLMSQLTSCGIDATLGGVGESREAGFFQVSVSTPDDSAVFLVNPATNEIRAGDANGDRYIGMCGL
jgi:hypothetical protein